MNLQTASALLKKGRLRLLWNTSSLFAPFYRITFLASASRAGVLALLADGPKTFAVLAASLAPNPATHDSLAAWLALGVKLGELGERGGVYSLEGYLARKLADPANDEVAALIEEVSTFHHRLILETPSRLRSGALWDVAEHDGPLIARSSRIMEPFVHQIIDWAIPSAGPLSLLEIGCGSGTYLRRAAERNPLLSGVGVEMQGDVADVARRSIAGWGLANRVRVETGDVRDRPSDPSFDVVTLYNAIYYFPREERVAVLAKLASFLKPGGRLLLSTSCRGGSPGMQMLNVWTSSTRGFGPLPTKDELVEQAIAAGFVDVETKHVIPGEPYVALVAHN